MEALYDHQKKIIAEDPKWAGLFLGTGTGKTRTASELAEGLTIVVCPKTQKEDKTWENCRDEFGLVMNLMVVSKEYFRAHHKELPRCNTLIIDEGHHHLGVTPYTRRRKGQTIPKTSQLFEATLWYLQTHQPDRFYLCTATPVSKPMNMWAIASLFGKRWDFAAFRQKYHFEKPRGYTSLWLPKTNKKTEDELADLVKRFGYRNRLQECFDVPEQTDRTVYLEMTTAQRAAVREIQKGEADLLVKRAKMRTIENGILYTERIEQITPREEKLVKYTETFASAKIEYILERASEFPKLVVFANYTGQVDEISKALEAEGYSVAKLTGATKNRGEVIKAAEAAEKCVMVIQSSVSEGYNLPSFPCIIFASFSWKYRDYEQARGRVLRANALKKNLYIHLVTKGGADQDCYKSIMAGKNFQEKIYDN